MQQKMFSVTESVPDRVETKKMNFDIGTRRRTKLLDK